MLRCVAPASTRAWAVPARPPPRAAASGTCARPAGVHVCVSSKQNAHDSWVCALTHRGVAEIIAQVDVGAPGHKQPHHAGAASPRCPLQCRLVQVNSVDSPAHVEKQQWQQQQQHLRHRRVVRVGCNVEDVQSGGRHARRHARRGPAPSTLPPAPAPWAPGRRGCVPPMMRTSHPTDGGLLQIQEPHASAGASDAATGGGQKTNM